MGSVHGSIQIQLQVLFLSGSLEQYCIPQGENKIVIDTLVVQHQLMQDAALVQPRFFLLLTGTAYMHSDFTAGIASQYRPVLYQGCPGSVTSCRDSRAKPGQASAHHNKVILLMDFLESLHRLPPSFF